MTETKLDVNNLPLGTRVIVRAQMVAKKDWIGNSQERKYHSKPFTRTFWENDRYKTVEITKPGIIVGARSAKEGKIKYDYDFGSYFTDCKGFRVYLVALNMAQIIKVRPEDLEVAPDA